MKFTSQEIATMLAALRNWQHITSPEGGNDPREISPYFDDHEPLTAEQIDELCERINVVGDE
jgi:hypothetical protein